MVFLIMFVAIVGSREALIGFAQTTPPYPFAPPLPVGLDMAPHVSLSGGFMRTIGASDGLFVGFEVFVPLPPRGVCVGTPVGRAEPDAVGHGLVVLEMGQLALLEL